MENITNSFQNVNSAIKEHQKKHEEYVELENTNKKIKDAFINNKIKIECSELYKLFIDTIKNEVPKDINECNYNNIDDVSICGDGKQYEYDNKIKVPYMREKYGTFNHVYDERNHRYFDTFTFHLKINDYCSEFNEFNMKLIKFRSGLKITTPTVYVKSEKLPEKNIDYNKLNFDYKFYFIVSLK